MEVKGNMIVAIVGPVGSGKSSLCQALIREMGLKSGESHQGGTISYVAQQVCIAPYLLLLRTLRPHLI